MIQLAAWRATSLESMLIWQLMYELIPAFVNECAHHTDVSSATKCARLLFIDSVQRYAVDEVIRAYILPPFLVYGYLLPKFLVCHTGLIFCGISK